MVFFTSMTDRSFRRLALVLLGVLAATVPARALDRVAFAQSLEAEGDYYRAIGQWKELRFDTTDPDVYRLTSQHILTDLWQANQFDLGLAETSVVSSNPLASTEASRELSAWKGLFQYKLSRFAEAEFTFQQANSPLYLGLLQARAGRLEAAQASWGGLGLPDPTTFPVETKSNLLAAGLSALLPGAGQVYAGHWYDGAQALAFCSFFGLSSYGTYLYDSKFSPNYFLTAVVGSVTAIFYVSNIYGASKTADYFNQNQQAARTEVFETAVLARGLPDLTRKRQL